MIFRVLDWNESHRPPIGEVEDTVDFIGNLCAWLRFSPWEMEILVKEVMRYGALTLYLGAGLKFSWVLKLLRYSKYLVKTPELCTIKHRRGSRSLELLKGWAMWVKEIWEVPLNTTASYLGLPQWVLRRTQSPPGGVTQPCLLVIFNFLILYFIDPSISKNMIVLTRKWQ